MSNFCQGVAEQELERDIERSFILLMRGAKDMVRHYFEKWNLILLLILMYWYITVGNY